MRGQQLWVVQSASIAALTANSANARAKNINIALMAIPYQEFVPLQSEYLFHGIYPHHYSYQNRQAPSVTAITFWSFIAGMCEGQEDAMNVLWSRPK